jgi:predicted DNA-binding transcriptional regulator YafY
MLCVLHILEEYSDEDHPLSTKDIISKMELLYDRTANRRTIYSAVEALQDFGYDISTYSDNGVGTYLIDRKFSSAEIKLLIDAIFSCEYISKKQTEELLDKLRSFLSVHERKHYSYTNIIAPEKKSPNPEVFLNIEILEQAISEKRQVSFTYMDYDYDKTLKPRREKPYIVSPYTMICEGSHYYLVLISKGHTDPSFYRIDMMKDIEILDEKIAISKREAKLNSAAKVIYAHAGEPETIVLRCKKAALRYVIERFGSDVNIEPHRDDDGFDATFRAAPEGLRYWALQYLQSVEVIRPEYVREELKKAVAESPYR